MADYLLDTNHASPLVTLGHPLRDEILRRLDEGHTFAICVPVLTETLFGISDSAACRAEPGRVATAQAGRSRLRARRKGCRVCCEPAIGAASALPAIGDC